MTQIEWRWCGSPEYCSSFQFLVAASEWWTFSSDRLRVFLWSFLSRKHFVDFWKNSWWNFPEGFYRFHFPVFAVLSIAFVWFLAPIYFSYTMTPRACRDSFSTQTFFHISHNCEAKKKDYYWPSTKCLFCLPLPLCLNAFGCEPAGCFYQQMLSDSPRNCTWTVSLLEWKTTFSLFTSFCFNLNYLCEF